MNLNKIPLINGIDPLKSGRASLRIGGITAIFGSACCIGHYLLAALGISSSTALYLITLAEWSRPFFILVAFISLCFAYQQIWRPELAYSPRQTCIKPRALRFYKAYFFSLLY